MERKIGEIKQVNGEWYQCVEGTGCYKCDFNIDENTCIADNPHCTCRSDKKNVIFKKLEKVGEPYFNGQYGEVLQEYKYYIPPITPDLRIHIIKLGIVGIEIKQNKEDMEEYEMHDAREDIPEFDKVVDECLFGKQELKLKPFDLQKAKAGKPVCTRDGRKARIICFDAEGNKPLIVLSRINGQEVILRYTEKGQSDNFHSPTPREDDLMMLLEKKEGWVNVYKDENNDDEHFTEKVIYKTRKDAFVNACPKGYVKTVKISWEE